MQSQRPNRRRLTPVWRAVIEVAFIDFLFYANLLMGEFTASNARGKTFSAALTDIFTAVNFAIALVSALIGYLVVEYLRRKL
jgi:fatty acid desaturase